MIVFRPSSCPRSAQLAVLSLFTSPSTRPASTTDPFWRGAVALVTRVFLPLLC